MQRPYKVKILGIMKYQSVPQQALRDLDTAFKNFL